ncbi:MAG: hypothetical protein RL253_1421, partial [Bacteroidota bacterium]
IQIQFEISTQKKLESQVIDTWLFYFRETTEID